MKKINSKFLRKLDFVIKSQIKNKKLIKNKISGFKDIYFRKVPKNSIETADALIFFLNSNKLVIKCRKNLNKRGIQTKILPEATKWHFVAEWEHIKELKLKHKKVQKCFPQSKKILSRAVSLPIFVKLPKNYIKKVYDSVKETVLNQK